MTPRITDLSDIVEKNIVALLRTFHENPAIFLSESDVESYLYSLLINEPEIRDSLPTMTNFSAAREASKSLLVHANLRVNIKNRDRLVDLSIFQPRSKLDWADADEWESMIGIEIKFNRRVPASRKERCGIIEDVKKVSDYKRGYVVWVNWGRAIDDAHLDKCKKEAEKYNNVKIFYLDVFSDPIKTNVTDL